MGSMIHLSVGRLEIDWGKNSGFTDHSPLFQTTDLAQVPYYYVDEANPQKEGGGEFDYNLITKYKDGLSKPLWQVIERIKLLGYTLEYAKHEFLYLSLLNSFDTTAFSFEQLAEALAKIDVNNISADYGEGGEDFGKFFRRHLFDKLGLEKIVDNPHFVRFHVGQGMENLSAYTILLLLAENPFAQNLPVTWQFADVETGGWARREAFIKPLSQSNRFLIVTEGSSDAGILKHAFKLLKPHIADFFDFVDMDEGYPFSGTGNLYNFTKGLIGISVRNNIVILYDNDAEGVSSFKKTQKLNLLKNMRVLRLPDLPVFKHFDTVGPSGNHKADINGRAAAIECYLDLGSNPIVQWTSYNKDIGQYHGEITGKGQYMRRFYAVKSKEDKYDFSNILAVLDMIISACAAMRETELLEDIQAAIDAEFPMEEEET